MGRKQKHNVRSNGAKITSPLTLQTINKLQPQNDNNPEPNVLLPELIKSQQPLLVQLDIADDDDQNIVKSRKVFISTVCHTCKSGQKASNIIKLDETESNKLFNCGSCRMISYCSKEHQLEDWENHKEFCHVIRKTLKNENKKYLYEDCTKYSFLDETKWIQIRYRYMSIFADQIKRDLQSYEKEMILFPRICIFCQEVSCNKMNNCKTCYMVSSCSQQQLLNHDHCSELKLLMNLVRFETEYGLIRPSFNPEATLIYKNIHTEFPSDITLFFENLLLDSKFPDDEKQEIWMAGVTEIATVPLSIIWAIKTEYSNFQENMKSKLIIHLLGAEMEFEGCCVSKWETFLLHLLPELKYIHIVFIGPELQFPSYPLHADVCPTCKSEGSVVSLEQRPGLFYHEYVTEEDYIKPDIICAFNCGIYRKTGYNGEDTWAKSIPFLMQAKIVITTSYTESEGDQDRQRILNECPGLKHNIFVKNPFRSLRPQRTLVNECKEPLMYKNQFINVFN